MREQFGRGAAVPSALHQRGRELNLFRAPDANR